MARHMLEAFRPKAGGNPVAFVHATSYADDRQVMQYLGDYFTQNGMEALYAAPDHLRWQDGCAVSIQGDAPGPVGGIVRFFPLEWLVNLPRSARWQGYYQTATPSCNHPVAMLAQAKRLPLVWDELSLDLPVWHTLLPETRDPRAIKNPGTEWVLKPNLGRVGEGISIKEAVPTKELRQIERAAQRHPKDWVAQRRFASRPLETEDGGNFHLCVGAFTVQGRAAGFYGRISPYPRIDARAKDIPVLIEEEGRV